MKTISDITKLSEKDQQLGCRWVSKNIGKVLPEVMKIQKKNFYTFKSQFHDVDLSILSAAAFLVAAHECRSLSQGEDKKAQHGDLSKVKSSTKLRAMQLKKSSSSRKYEQLLNLKSLILRLIDVEGLSYRETSSYLYKFHKGLSISHSLIGTFYNNMKKGEK